MCLSTVDRRSRERFIESNNQIASLVEKFKIEGGAYRKFAGLNSQPDLENMEQHQKVPLTAYGRPGTFRVFTNLIKRLWTRLAPTNSSSWKTFALKMLLMPCYFFLLWVFYFDGFKEGADEKNQYQRTFVTRNGLVFNSLAGAYFMSIIITAATCKKKKIRQMATQFLFNFFLQFRLTELDITKNPEKVFTRGPSSCWRI